MKKSSIRKKSEVSATPDYTGLVGGIAEVLEIARRTSARAVNAVMTATYWEVGRRIVEFEQGGKKRAEYGEEILVRLSTDLTSRFGKGFSRFNLGRFRQFYLTFSAIDIRATLSLESSNPSKRATLSHESGKPENLQLTHERSSLPDLRELARAFPLPWSSYVELTRSSRSPEALAFYHTEALRGGWTVRQLKRQIDTQFYERTALSRDKVAMLKKGAKSQPADKITADEEIKDPLVLEFLGLKDEYSESDLEEALILHLEHFLLELGNDFAFVGRQRRLRIDDEWFRVDLLFYHRRLHCLVIIDLKLGKFSHADAGQMHLYLNYAAEHWTQPGENPPVGMILCSAKGNSLVRYSTENLPNKILVRDYLTALPDERTLAAEIAAARKKLEARKP
jgi:predicted nuclease of restriction endonuclease-like (RecB) superfamily